MASLAEILLEKVKETVNLQSSNRPLYEASFETAGEFVAATIGGKLEFVPVSLLLTTHDLYLTNFEIEEVFGVPEQHPQLDDRLIAFYKENNLKRDIQNMTDPVLYYVKPRPSIDKDTEDDFFDTEGLIDLAGYAGKSYSAKDQALVAIGQRFAELVMSKTNQWAEKLTLDGFQIETERYWQVAGYFKTFTWAKIFKKDTRDKRIFFSVGIDLKQGSLVFKLDCLRSGSHKLSNLEIRKFDYMLQDKQCIHHIPFNYILRLNWRSLCSMTEQFVQDMHDDYIQVNRYVWSGVVDHKIYRNKLFPVKLYYHSPEGFSSSNSIDKVDLNDVYDLIIELEQFMLNHSGKDDLAAMVERVEGSWHQVNTFEFDGTRKQIVVVATCGGTRTAFSLNAQTVEALATNDHAYLYHIVEYDPERKTGKLIIRKGDPVFYAKLEPTAFTATV